MKYLIYFLTLASVMQNTSLVAADFAVAREAVTSNLKSLKASEIGKDSWVTSTSNKLSALNLALPASDDSFKTSIQKGIEALNEIQNQENDTLILDLFVLSRSFTEYYRSRSELPEYLQNPALVNAFKSFETGETDNALAYFNRTLQSLLFAYRHYYPLFNEPIPDRIAMCQIEYIGSAYLRNDAEGPDEEIVYAVTTNWTLAFAKLKTLPVSSRNAAIQAIEEALDSDEMSNPPIEAVARKHLTEAKAFFQIEP